MATGIPPLSILAIFSAVFPVIAGGIRYGRQPRDLRIFYYLMVLNGIDAAIQFVLANNNINNYWVIHLYNLFEVPTMLWIYSRWFKREGIRASYLILAVSFILFWFVSKFTFESLAAPSIYVGPTSRVILTVLSIHALYEVSKDIEISLLTNHRFWISGGTILYMSGAVMFYALQGLFIELTREVILRIFYIYWTFIILIHLIYSGAFLCKTSPQNSGGHLVSAP